MMDSQLLEAAKVIQTLNDEVIRKDSQISHLLKVRNVLSNVLRDSREFAARQTETAVDQAVQEQQQMFLEFKTNLLRDVEAGTDELNREISMMADEHKYKLQELYAVIERLDSDLSRANQTIGAYEGRSAAPRRFTGATVPQVAGNSLIDALMSKTETVFDSHDAVATKRGWVVRLKPRGLIGAEDVKKHLPALHVWLGLSEVCELTVKSDNGFIVIGMTDPNLNESEVVSQDPDPTGLPADWLARVIQYGEVEPVPDKDKKAYHARFVGESESGKSSLVKNCINVLRTDIPDLVVKLADPLYDSGESTWDIPAVYRDDDEAAQAIRDASEMVKNRKGNPDLKQVPTLFIVDEIDTVMAGDKSLADDVKTVWRQGRHVKVWLWVIGQSPNVKTFPGLALPDFNNCVQFFLNQVIPYAVGQFRGFDYIHKDYQTLVDSEVSKYLVMVKPKLGRAFVTVSPKPDSYKTSDQSLQTTSTPERSEDPRLSEIRQLAATGLKQAEIVKQVYGLNPSRSQDYQRAKQTVETALAAN